MRIDKFKTIRSDLEIKYNSVRHKSRKKKICYGQRFCDPFFKVKLENGKLITF